MPGGQWISPWRYEASDYQGRRVSVQIAHDNVTPFAIVAPGLTGKREVGCIYDRVVIGSGRGNKRVFLIPEGDFSVTRQQMSQRGFDNITDVTDSGFTLGTEDAPV